MMKANVVSTVVILVILLLPDASSQDARAQVVGIMCGTHLVHNASVNIPNFVQTMEYISLQIRNSGFGMAVAGPGVDANFGLAQCYGDLSSEACISCYAEARTVLPQCFPVNEARIYLDGCFMRVANYSFFEEYAGPSDRVVCGNTTQRDIAFQGSAIRAMSLAVDAAPNRNGYVSQVASSGGATVEVLANCWRTINASSCRRCLENASASLSRCLPWSEGRAMNTGCFMRYSDRFFLNRPAPENGISRGTRRAFIIAGGASAAGTCLIVAAIIILRRRMRMVEKKNEGTIQKEGRGDPTTNVVLFRHRKAKTQNHIDIEDFLKNNENLAPRRYKYSDLKKITYVFSDKLGKGGFGSVYKGKLHDGRLVAVKILNESKGSGEEFMNEVASISRTSHVNIVTLLGFCYESSRRALVYEFMPNGSLEKYLNKTGSSTTEGCLGWEKLFEIAVGVARGLEYLHQGCNTRILHLDIKPHNILLDKDLRPKISDFGLAKLCPDRASIISMLGARGTVGYIAPEIFCRNFGDVSKIRCIQLWNVGAGNGWREG